MQDQGWEQAWIDEYIYCYITCVPVAETFYIVFPDLYDYYAMSGKMATHHARDLPPRQPLLSQVRRQRSEFNWANGERRSRRWHRCRPLINLNHTSCKVPPTVRMHSGTGLTDSMLVNPPSWHAWLSTTSQFQVCLLMYFRLSFCLFYLPSNSHFRRRRARFLARPSNCLTLPTFAKGRNCSGKHSIWQSMQRGFGGRKGARRFTS